jgi:HSP20 family molecular chaperone IbpA
MTRYTAFGSPLLLGFDHLERLLDQVSKNSAEGYPPYNIERLDDNRLRITLAVAGFAADDLDVQEQENQLIIRGRQPDDERERTFLHRGIASRQFQRSFVLAENIEIRGASLDNGLLHIDLEREVHRPTARTIEIESAKAPAKGRAKTVDVSVDE